MLRHFSAVVFLCALLAATAISAAPPELGDLFPAGGQRGQTVTVTASGTFATWPVEAWVDGAGMKIEAAKKKGELTVTIAGDAQPGLRWVRLFNAEGASAPRPFVVGTLAEVTDQEPNDEPAKAQKLAGPSVVNGKLAKAGDVDCFAITLAKGQTLVANVDAETMLGSPMDAILQITNTDGIVLAQNNDDHGLDPRLALTAPADGTYVVRIFAFSSTPSTSVRFAGGDKFSYRLTITGGGYLDYVYPLAVTRGQSNRIELCGWNIPESVRRAIVAPMDDRERMTIFSPQLAGTSEVTVETCPSIVESEPNDLARPQSLALPAVVSGRIDAPGDVDAYSFTGKKGQRLGFRVESRALGFPTDPVLQITNADGKVLTTVDDVKLDRDAEVNFGVPADGDYRATIQDLYGHGSSRHVYRLRAAVVEPVVILSLANHAFTVSPAKPQEVVVTVDRRGFASDLVFTVEGLPTNVTVGEAKLAGKDVATKSVTLKLTATAGPFSGPIRIVGKSSDATPLIRTATADLTAPTAKTTEIWLTVTK
jgi:hypothetical protein